MNTNTKIDLYQEHKDDYRASRKPVLLEIGEATYLAVTGRGEPGGEDFTDAIGALYAVAFTVKMTRKFGGQQNYAVCKLEGQWWAADGRENFASLPQEKWHWDLLIRTPKFVAPSELETASEALLKKGKPPAVRKVRLESFTEGKCVQMLHVGPYEQEHETIRLMRDHASQHHLKFHGRHHEIYLSDPRRVPPERLRTLLRQPVTNV